MMKISVPQTEESILNIVKLNQIWIVITLLWLIWQQTKSLLIIKILFDFRFRTDFSVYELALGFFTVGQFTVRKKKNEPNLT